MPSAVLGVLCIAHRRQPVSRQQLTQKYRLQIKSQAGTEWRTAVIDDYRNSLDYFDTFHTRRCLDATVLRRKTVSLMGTTLLRIPTTIEIDVSFIVFLRLWVLQ